MIFAQAENVPAEAWKNYALITMALIGTVYFIMEIIGRSKKRNVTLDSGAASKAEFDLHVAENKREHENLFSKIGGVERGVSQRLELKIDAMRVENSEGREKLHDRMNDVVSELGELRGTVNAFSK